MIGRILAAIWVGPWCVAFWWTLYTGGLAVAVYLYLKKLGAPE